MPKRQVKPKKSNNSKDEARLKQITQQLKRGAKIRAEKRAVPLGFLSPGMGALTGKTNIKMGTITGSKGTGISGSGVTSEKALLKEGAAIVKRLKAKRRRKK